MGWYIECPVCTGKVEWLVEHHGARILGRDELEPIKELPAHLALVCVVDNGPFDAASYCYDQYEFEAFNDPSDWRPRTWLLMDKAWVEKATGYNNEG